MVSIIREVLSQRNILVISLTTSLFSVVEMFYRPFWSLYLLELGASLEVIGLLSVIQGSSYLILQLPGGFLADRIGRKKVIVYFTLTNVLAPTVFLWATTWEQIIPGILIGALSSVYMPAFNAMISESIPYKRRGAGYGAYRMITSIPWAFSPLFGGILMDWLGLVYGVRLFLQFMILVTITITIIRALTLRETLAAPAKGEEKEKEGSSLSAFKQAPRAIYFMLLTGSISSFGLNLIMPYIVIYARESLKLSYTEWGLISMVTGLISMFLAIPGGMLSDKIGRRLSILIGKLMSPLSFLGLTLSTNFTHVFLSQTISAVGSGFGLGAYGEQGGPAWQSLIADLIPSKMRARIMGMMGTMTGLSGLPSPMIGGYLYNTYSPQTAFIAAASLGIVGTVIFGLTVKEPKEKQV